MYNSSSQHLREEQQSSPHRGNSNLLLRGIKVDPSTLPTESDIKEGSAAILAQTSFPSFYRKLQAKKRAKRKIEEQDEVGQRVYEEKKSCAEF